MALQCWRFLPSLRKTSNFSSCWTCLNSSLLGIENGHSMCARDIPLTWLVSTKSSPSGHSGHFQGKQLVLLTRTPEGEQKSRDADGTFATSPVEQIALTRATMLLGLWGWSGDKGLNLSCLHERQLSPASVQVDQGSGPENHQSRAWTAFSNCGYSGIDCAMCIHVY